MPTWSMYARRARASQDAFGTSSMLRGEAGNGSGQPATAVKPTGRKVFVWPMRQVSIPLSGSRTMCGAWSLKRAGRRLVHRSAGSVMCVSTSITQSWMRGLGLMAAPRGPSVAPRPRGRRGPRLHCRSPCPRGDVMEQTRFTAMRQATREDYQVIGRHSLEYFKGLPDRVLTHLKILAGDTGGYAVDRLTHSLQTATRAQRDGRDEEYV